MIPKNGYRSSEKIMLKQKAKVKFQINQNIFALAAFQATPARNRS